MAKIAKKKISVLGLGKLGACYAAFYASKGYSVLGYDINKNTVRAINKGQAPVDEPDLKSYIHKNRSRLSATEDISRLVSETDVTFLIVPTPSKKNGIFSISAILDAAKAIGPALKDKKSYHTFVVVSTVLPGDSRQRIIPAFERASGKKCGVDFGYVYSPSLIALGSVLRNLEIPDVLLVGAFDDRSRRTVEAMYATIYPKHEIDRMTPEETELAKISINSYITSKISFANTLGMLCAAIPNTDVDTVTRVVGKDSRIGLKYFSAGLGFGGPCFPRDNKAFSAMAHDFGVAAHQARATDSANADMLRHMIRLVRSRLAGIADGCLGFAGISYKHGTSNLEASHSLEIARAFADSHQVLIYESQGTQEVEKVLGSGVTYLTSLRNLVLKSDVIFLSNPDPRFAEIPKLIKNKKIVIIDPWGMFRGVEFDTLVEYDIPARKRSSEKPGYIA